MGNCFSINDDIDNDHRQLRRNSANERANAQRQQTTTPAISNANLRQNSPNSSINQHLSRPLSVNNTNTLLRDITNHGSSYSNNNRTAVNAIPNIYTNTPKIDAYGNIILSDKPKLTYRSNDLISNGNISGKIYSGFLNTKKIALKEVAIRDKKDLENEIAILSRIEHLNIIRLYYDYEINGKLFLLTEFYEKPRLKFPLMTENYKKNMMIQLTDAVKYLQEMKIVHLQIIPENMYHIQIGTEYRLKLTNFSRAKEMRGTSMLYVDNIIYEGFTAPEICGNLKIFLESDIWSLGCNFFYFQKGILMTEAKYENQIMKVNNRINHIAEDTSEKILLKDLIGKMLVYKPGQRLSAENVKNHPFFWSGKQTSDFIVEISKILESKDANFRREIFKGSNKVFDDEWIDRVDDEVVDELNKYQKSFSQKNNKNPKNLDGKSILSLITKIRNITSHAPNEVFVRYMGGSTHETIMNYWTGLFPKLIVHIYNAKMRYDNKENYEN